MTPTERAAARNEPHLKDLARLGIHPVPLPLSRGPEALSIYLLLAGPPVLIDTGVGGPLAAARLIKALNHLGVDPRRIEHVFLTHAHPDHAGAAAELAKTFGLSVWVHPLEAPRLDGRQARFVRESLPVVFRRLGVDEAMSRLTLPDLAASARAYDHQRLEEALALADGQRLPIEGLELFAVHTPGHSPGSLCFLDRGHRILFSGDTLLSQGASQPTLSLDAQETPYFQGLIEMQQSLERLDSLGEVLVLPGHGPPAPLPGLVSKARAAFEKKRSWLLRHLQPGATPYDLIRRRALRTQGAFLLADLYFTRCLLEALRAEGLVRLELDGDRERVFPESG